jgi:RNA polymerase sigma-70 factor (ECF subfamily)
VSAFDESAGDVGLEDVGIDLLLAPIDAAQPLTVLDLARAGDPAAFADLYRDTQPRLLRYAATLVGQDAEDVTAEAWLQIARDLRRFSGESQAFRAWAVTIVRNRAMDQIRAANRRPATPMETSYLDTVSNVDTAVSAEETMSTAAALRLIATLPRDQAEAVLLRTVIGLDAATAAAVLGKRAGAVRVAAHRGLKGLRQHLDQTREPTAETAADRVSDGPG